MNYIFYKELDNSIVGIRKTSQELSDDLIADLTLDMSNNFETKILCASVSEDVETAEFMTRYLGFDPQNNVLISNPDFTPTPQPSLEEEPIPEA